MRIVLIFIGSRMNPLNLFKTRSNVCITTGAYTHLYEVAFSPVFLTNQMILRKIGSGQRRLSHTLRLWWFVCDGPHTSQAFENLASN